MSEWLPIDTAPKDGTVIDVWGPNNRIPNVRWGKYFLAKGLVGDNVEYEGWSYQPMWWENRWEDIAHFGPEAITHWMPLPDPPKT